MADDLINKLANQIKAKEESAAQAQQIQLHKADFIRSNAPQWFTQFTDAFRASAQALNQALAGSASGTPEIKTQANGAHIFSLSKEDFPAVRVNASLDVPGLSLNIGATSAARKGQNPKEWQLHLQFDVDGTNNLMLRNKPGDPTFSVSTPKELSDSLMESVFSV